MASSTPSWRPAFSSPRSSPFSAGADRVGGMDEMDCTNTLGQRGSTPFRYVHFVHLVHAVHPVADLITQPEAPWKPG